MSRILIIEDEPVIRNALSRLLQRHGHETVEAGSIDEAEAAHDWDEFALVIADIRLPGQPGTVAISKAKPVPVLVMTSYASVKSAVEAMKEGAVDYITKPFDHDEMVLSVQRILQQDRLEQENARLRSELSHCYPVEGMIGDSQAMQEVFNRIHRVAPTDATVLILGESGSGKELVARALHEMGQRKNGPFIAVNCAAIPDSLMESELFGHEKGAFTGAGERRVGLVEAADGGTLFLDEIGELPTEAQARLLRVLQEGEVRRLGANRTRRVDIRLLAATHRDLQQCVRDGNFREDLFFRLHVMEIRLPALRERGNDIETLAQAMLEKSCRRLNHPPKRLSSTAVKRLHSYHWPGNVRELENVIERAVILSEGNSIDASDLAIDTSDSPAQKMELDNALSLDDYLVEFVTRHQQEMTETELARQLGISRKTLWEKRQRLGIPRQRG